MPDIEYDSILMTSTDVREVLTKALNAQKTLQWPDKTWTFNNYPATLSAVNDVADDENLVWNIWMCSDTNFNTRYYNDGWSYIRRVRQGFKLNVNSGKRACIVRAKTRVVQDWSGDSASTDALVDIWMVIGQSTDSTTLTSRHLTFGSDDKAYPTPMRQEIIWDGDGQISAGTPSVAGNPIDNFNNSLVTPASLRTRGNDTGLNNLHLKSEHLTKLTTIRAHNANYGWSWNGYDSPQSGYSFYSGFPQYTSGTDSVMIAIPEQFPSGIPVFDLNHATAAQIIAYLDTGDDTGSEDPFDPENPEEVVIKDFKTNYTIYLTNDSSTMNHFSVYAQNSQFDANPNALGGKYGLFVSNTPAGQTVESGFYRPAIYANPVVSGQIAIPTTGNSTLLTCYFGAYPTSSAEYLAGHYSGAFVVSFKPKAASAVKCQIEQVEYHDSPGDESYTIVSRTDSIDDGYVYTASTGETLTILFRAISLDDIGDPDDGYPESHDTENSQSGSDPAVIVGRGFRTYKLSSSGFDEVSSRLWGMTWTDGKVDPIQAVISSKLIPFDHTGTATDVVYLSTLEIDCSCVYVNQVKSYDCGSLTISPIRSDFTDIYLTRIHVYLPFIGWVELPASEVVSRGGRAAYGITSVTKILKFKYIVDFLSGDCRCIIAVNNTERWFFDGNCGADAPLTYDNHVSAITKSSAAIGQCLLSVAGTVGGAISGQPMLMGASALSAVSAVSNIIPNYNYTWTSSSSGWVGQSMNKYIMVVVESPRVEEPSGYGHKLGRPCERNLTLGTLRGFTKTKGADTSSIDCSPEEHQMLEEMLNTGVYL